MNILSDGIKDGIVLFYAKDGILYPVGMTDEQVQTIDLMLGMGLEGKLKVFTDQPMGDLINLKK